MLVYIYTGIAATFIIGGGFLMLYMKLYSAEKKKNQQLSTLLKHAQIKAANAVKNAEAFKIISEKNRQDKERIAKLTAKQIVSQIYPSIANNDMNMAKEKIKQILKVLK
jgi:hypothetical protein